MLAVKGSPALDAAQGDAGLHCLHWLDIHAAEANMSNVLVIVYSYTGTSRRVAELLCSQQNWPLASITEVQPRAGGLGSLRCVIDSLLRRRPAIRYDGPPPTDFDAVVLVSPIWLLQLASPMRAFVARQRGRLPDVAVLSVMGGQGAPNAAAEIARILDRAPILSSSVTMREVDDGSCAARLQAFGTAVRDAEASHDVVRPVTLSPQSS
ncbi:flavodoxin family protein [Variovorax sp. 22077]|uniref:flavodoxin family protein n=1 Tax=Variovorax sp. 22077 TaxID=3453867 RepID=UPI003F86329C